MSQLIFEFEHSEMVTLLSGTNSNQSLLVSIVPAQENPSSARNLFLAARVTAPSSTTALTNKVPPVGCPVPPGWKQISPAITASQLEGKPQFIISPMDTKKIKEHRAPNNRLLAKVDGELVNGELMSRITFDLKNTPSDATIPVIGNVL